MLLPVKWLKDYIDINEDTRKIADEITLTGSHVESIENRIGDIKNVVIGKIVKIEKHPDADKLKICSIDVGKEMLQIITAATNVFEGAYVPVALVGAVLAGDLKIKKSKLRGVDSYGMLCSYEELGVDVSVIPRESRDGILIFPEEIELGQDALTYLNFDDEVIELEITPNRPDCLSIIGMARETAATFGLELNEPKIEILNETEDINDYVEGIQIDTDKCNRYYSKVLKNVKIGPSPLWLQNYLMAAGVRPISNIVDLTNFAMLEYGQPLHAFDLTDLSGRKIVVRQAEDDEELITLDEITRKLSKEDIVIADGEKAIGLAGVMGGFNSEIKDETKTVLLEGANFDESSIRKTSKKFGLRTEASTRFEKGIDANFAKTAVDRVCQLAETIGAAEVVGGEIDVYKNKSKTYELSLRPERCNMILGVDLEIDQMINILNSLGIESKYNGNEIISVIPTFRHDIEIEEDLIEEVGRIYGFHNIKPQPLKGALTRGTKPKHRVIEEKMKSALLGMGYNEFMTYSFISPKAYDKINVDKDSEIRNSVKLINPLGEEYSIMRRTLIPNMLELLSRNSNRGNNNVFGFEFGNIFIPSKDKSMLPTEELFMTIAFYGDKDFYFLKETLIKVMDKVGISPLTFKEETNTSYLHPGRSASVSVNNISLGVLGEVHPAVLDNYDIKNKIYISEIKFKEVVDLAKEDKKYKPLPKFPSVKRDLAIILDKDIPAGNIEEIARDLGGELLEEFKIFDIYTGDQIEDSKKSIAFSLIYRASDRTLTEKEINKIQEKIIDEIKDKLNGQLRV